MSEPQAQQQESLLTAAEPSDAAVVVSTNEKESARRVVGTTQHARSRIAVAFGVSLLLAAVLGAAVSSVPSSTRKGEQMESAGVLVESEDKSPCKVVNKTGVAKFADEKHCDDAKKMPSSCVKPGQNCSAAKCCAWDGMQCFQKDETWASCRWHCTAGPDLTEEKYNNWNCKTLGPRTPGKINPPTTDAEVPSWVGKKCAKDGENCGKSRCCASPGTKCYEKTMGWAICMDRCTPGPSFRDKGSDPWTCKELGPRTLGKAKAPPPPVRFEELPDWVGKKCTETGPKDCSKSQCCQDPNMQCYEKSKGWAVCQERCFKGQDPNDKAGGNWSCKELGPRTPIKCPACAPKAPVAPDVIIPFFERDLCKLKYTAKSLGVNDPDGHLGDVYLMWISSKPVSQYQSEIDEALNLIRKGPHGKKAELVDFKERMDTAQPHPIGGWHAQQLSKLKMASVVKTDFYMVMDSKNTLIRPVTGDMFFTECNQAIIQAEFPWYKIPVPHSDWYERSARVLNLGKPDSGFWPASITPIILHRQTVIDMLKQMGEDPSVDQLCAGPVCEQIGAFSASGHGATEFTLYTLFAYAKRSQDELKCIHDIDPMRRFKLEYSSDWQAEMEKKLRELSFPTDPQQVTVSSGDGWPLDWTPAQGGDSSPSEDKFPLKFEDLTHKWAASLWRGEASNADLLVEVNLHTLSDTVNGVRQFPVMFGAQPASLNPMDGTDKKDRAVGDLTQMYKNANLYDESDDLVGCVVGYKN